MSCLHGFSSRLKRHPHGLLNNGPKSSFPQGKTAVVCCQKEVKKSLFKSDLEKHASGCGAPPLPSTVSILMLKTVPQSLHDQARMRRSKEAAGLAFWGRMTCAFVNSLRKEALPSPQPCGHIHRAPCVQAGGTVKSCLCQQSGPR